MFRQKKYLKFLFIISVMLGWCLPIQRITAQESTKTIEVLFKVRDEAVLATTPISGVSVSVTEKGTVVQTRKTAENGNVSFKLDLYKEYLFTFVKKGFATKKFWINANVKGKEGKSKLEYYNEIIVNMYLPTSDKLVSELLDEPFGRFTYFTANNEFDFEKGYDAILKAKLAKLSAKDRENKINQLKGGVVVSTAADPKAEEKYKAAIAIADKAISTKDYSKAKEAYNQALSFKPDDKYAKDKLNVIQAIQKPLTPADKKFNEFIEKADLDFTAKQYEEAKKQYQEALKIKPKEQYVKDQLAKVDEIITKDKAKRYKDAVLRGDKAFLAKDYAKARIAYNDAVLINANEKYPKEKIAEMDKLYKDAIYKADKLFINKEYDRAKQAYNEGLVYKPGESYSTEKIKEINKILKTEDSTADYGTLIANGDNAFKAKDYLKAKNYYNAALKQKPTEKYPKDQLIKVQAAIDKDPNIKKNLEKQYSDLMKRAKDAMEAKDYETAKDAYAEASTLKPEQKFPTNQIAKIDQLIKEADTKYKELIAEGDKQLKAKSYDKAKAAYEEAQTYKPTEKYPGIKLAELEKLKKQPVTTPINNTPDKYKELLAQADKAFNAKQYEQAKMEYTAALASKPNDTYVTKQLAEIEKLLTITPDNNAIVENKYDPGNRMEINQFQLSQNISTMRDEIQLKQMQMKELKKRNEKKVANMSAKYDTENPLTKLFDIVDTKPNSSEK